MWPGVIDRASDVFFVSFSQRRLVHHLNSHQQEEKPLCLACSEYFFNEDSCWRPTSTVCVQTWLITRLLSSHPPAALHVMWPGWSVIRNGPLEFMCGRIGLLPTWTALYSLCSDRASRQRVSSFVMSSGWPRAKMLIFHYWSVNQLHYLF